MGGERNGIDVSAHQGLIRWNEVCADFAILRAGWSWYEGGMNIDQRFLENVSGVQDEGVPWGVYLYAYDKSPAAARISANRLADLLDKYQIPYPVAYDFEDKQYLQMSKGDNTAICKAFLDTLQGRGYYAMLYTYTSFAKGYLRMEELAGYDFWVADYTGKVGWPGTYGMWQYSGSGEAQGITGKVDLNTAYKDYPAIIQATGLNGYGKSQDDSARVRELEAEVTALRGKIKNAQAALE